MPSFAAGPVYVGGWLAALAATMAMLLINPKGNGRAATDSLTKCWRGSNTSGKKIVLGSISLDLFAVLLGGAVALLPVYAREILKTGPWGLGLLRSAPGAGAAVMAIFLATGRCAAGWSTMLWV